MKKRKILLTGFSRFLIYMLVLAGILYLAWPYIGPYVLKWQAEQKAKMEQTSESSAK